MTTLLNDPLVVRGLVTVALLFLVAALRLILFRLIRRGADVLTEDQRRQLFYSRSALSALLVIGLLVIWLGQLQNLLLSLTAVTVAIVIATKELLMCISGFALRTGASVFSIGDRIEVNGLRGEVTDHSVLSTTLLELTPASRGDSYSGRTIVLPNSIFLHHPVSNENFSPSFALHSFTITLETLVQVTKALDWLQEKSEQLCQPFLEAAQRSNAMAEKKLGVDIQGPEPRVSISTSDLGRTNFHILLFCPKQDVLALEKSITVGFLDAVGSDAIPLSNVQTST